MNKVHTKGEQRPRVNFEACLATYFSIKMSVSNFQQMKCFKSKTVMPCFIGIFFVCKTIEES